MIQYCTTYSALKDSKDNLICLVLLEIISNKISSKPIIHIAISKNQSYKHL